MKFPISLLLVAVFVFTSVTFGQQPALQTVEEKEEKLRDAAVVFLRETYSDVGNMRSLENRISFTAELAGLLWYRDQKGGAAMFGVAVNDFKQLLAVYDGQMNSFGPTDSEADISSPIPFLSEATDRSKIERKFRTALGVRQQIAMSIAEHEPELAFNFFYDSVSIVTNPQFRKSIENQSASFEQQLLTRIATVDAKKAAALSQRTLSKGFSHQHVELLKRIYRKDPEAAGGLAENLVSRVRNEGIDAIEIWTVQSFLDFADTTSKPGKNNSPAKPVLSRSQMTELAEMMAKKILESSEDDFADPFSALPLIEKYSPGRAAQIRAKFKMSAGLPSTDAKGPAIYSGPVNTPAISSASNEGSIDPALKARMARMEEEKAAMADMKRLGNAELPKEEREKIIAKARQTLAQNSSKMQKIVGLSTLAAAVAKAGDKKLATELMQEAAPLVNPRPKNYQDMVTTWAFATGYANVDPDKAFPIFDDMIFKVNDLINAAVKIGEFVDVQEEVIVDGEFQVGAFGGEMVQMLSRSAGVADSTIKVLVDADLEKTRALTNRFDRNELRVLAKVMVLRTILGKPMTEQQFVEELFGTDTSIGEENR